MKIEIVAKDVLSISSDVLVLSLFQGGQEKLKGILAEVDTCIDGALRESIDHEKFEGKFGQMLVLSTLGKLKARKIAVIGLGEKKHFSGDALRKIGGCLVKIATQAKAESMVTIVHGIDVIDAKTAMHVLSEGMLLGAYRFHVYHGTLKKKEHPPTELKKVIVCEQDRRTMRMAQEGLVLGEVLAAATNYTRELVNTPSADMTPRRMAEEAKKLVGKGIALKVLDQKEMQRLGMNAALAVARGSDHEPVGVHLSYVPRGAKKKIAVIGKAVTFDSGGLSLKPADGMMTMKLDMAGGATVLGLFKALAVLKPPVAVHGIFLAVENMPGGSAYRPGDVVKAMDGTTIEVLNTDAEGRVTLADALSYAKTLNPDTMIDLATLTGACVVALGEEVAGLMTTDKKLGERLLAASKETGEALWELPLYEPYMDHVKSKIADIKNIGARGQAGTISAGMFLRCFTGSIPWAHLDIAGPSYIERETRPDQPYGASGYGVRLLIKFLQRL